jgi:hypothetical protein
VQGRCYTQGTVRIPIFDSGHVNARSREARRSAPRRSDMLRIYRLWLAISLLTYTFLRLSRYSRRVTLQCSLGNEIEIRATFQNSLAKGADNNAHDNE